MTDSLDFEGIKALRKCEKIRKRLFRTFINYNFFEEGNALFSNRDGRVVKVFDYFFRKVGEYYQLEWEKNISLRYGIRYNTLDGKLELFVRYLKKEDDKKKGTDDTEDDTEDDNVFFLDQDEPEKSYSLKEFNKFFNHINLHYHHRKEFLDSFFI